MADKIKSFVKENRFIVLSGLVALAAILLFYIIKQITPFGNNTLYASDLYHQYGPLFSELRDRLESGESLLYSWNTGLGSPFIGNFFNYLSSPFGLVVTLYSARGIADAISIIVACKVSLSATSMAYYLKKSQKLTSPMLIAFGVLYAFCGYFIAYFWNIMWMDSLYLFPLVILGIEKIIDSGKCANYIFALSLTMIINYYIAYMVCIFSCIYFIYYYICSQERIDYKQKILAYKGVAKGKLKTSFFVNSGLRFTLSSLASALIALFAFVPLIHVLSTSFATDTFQSDSSTSSLEIFTYFNIYEFLSNHLALTTPTFRSAGRIHILPNIYSGIISVFLIPLYMLSKKITKREKIASVGLLAVMFFSFCVNVFDFIWHGFHFPNDMPYRQSFMYSFILIILASKAYKLIDEFNKKHFFIIGGILAIFTISVIFWPTQYTTIETIIYSIIFIIAFTIVFFLAKIKDFFKKFLPIILCVLIVLESVLSYTLLINSAVTKTDFFSDYEGFKATQSYIDSEDTDLFYRSELTKNKTSMDPARYDFNGVSAFSSMITQDLAAFQDALGLDGNRVNSYIYYPQTPVYNAMFSVKYLYDLKGHLSESNYYTKQDVITTYFTFKNNYHLPLAYCVSDKIADWNALSFDLPGQSSFPHSIEAQEEFFNCATGIEDVFTDIYDYDISYENMFPIDSVCSKKDGKFSFIRTETKSNFGSIVFNVPVKKDSNYYAYVYSEDLSNISIYSKAFSTELEELEFGYIVDLGQQTAGDNIILKANLFAEPAGADIDFRVFTIDDEKFVEGYNQLKDGQITLTRFEETEISGTFTAEENEILYTSIPYDTGWSVELDGKKLDDDQIVVISDALLGVKVSAGEHNITFRYAIPGMAASNIISISFALLLIVLYILNKKNLLFFKNKKENLWLRAEGELPQETTDVDTVVEAIEKPEAPQQKKTNNQATPKKKKRKKRH